MPRFPYDAPGIPSGGQSDDIRTLEQLVADLKRYAGEDGPTPEELAAAPVIAGVSVVVDTSAWRLGGLVSGHPTVGPGLAMTSRIYAIDPERRWCRSYSRLWRIAEAPPVGHGLPSASRSRTH
ncbi:DUF6634 family protein [Jiella sp. M17.18]|uniref:DUF6634 family protein n=1 Tax=Jiella sp. M17.18 TaxID=3234247 RepID=UPI0034E01DF1